MKINLFRFLVAFIVPALLTLAGCGKPQATPAPTTATTAPASTTAASAPTAAPAAPASEAAKELAALQESIVARIHQGVTNESDFTAELAKFDQLLAEHKDDKSDDVAKILLSKAALYLQIFKDYDKATATLQQLAAQFPNTPSAAVAAKALPDLEQVVAASAIQKSLVVGAPFPDFSVADLDGQPLSVASYKGKVTLIDFWATWCGPCMQEMPNVIAAYAKYHDQGFDIIGISLDKENQHDALAAFLKTNHMPWRQFYDGKYWQNALALKYGVDAIPQSYLLDRTGKIVAVEPRGAALAPAIEAALAAK
jgi:peroxiredoxin